MAIRLAAMALLALAACAKKEAAPAAALAETGASPAADEAIVEDAARGPETENAAMACPVLDSRNWRAFTAPDGDGHALTIEGEVDMPTPGYALSWRAGGADRAMPPGLRVHLDATPPDAVVMQVVTPTPVSYSTTGYGANYRVVTVLCGGEAIAEITDVKPKG